MKHNGFSLIEMVIVIVIISVMVGVLVTILKGPMQQYIQVQQRAVLVDIAETALQRMAREIRLALPNSIRVASAGSVTSIEFLRTSSGGRYRDKPDGSNTDVCSSPDNDRIKFNASSDCFEILGSISNIPVTGGIGTTSQATCLQGGSDCLVIFNTGQAGANAYAGDNIAGIAAATANSITFDISGSPGGRFPYESPNQRFQIVDTPVSFLCDTGLGTIRRLDSYDILSSQPDDPPPGSSDFTATSTTLNNNLLINMVDSCSFTYSPGTSTRTAMVTIQITIKDDNLGEKITLLQQAHVDNQP